MWDLGDKTWANIELEIAETRKVTGTFLLREILGIEGGGFKRGRKPLQLFIANVKYLFQFEWRF